MSRPIIEVRNLSKRYHLGTIGATSLREEVARYWDRLRGVPHPDKSDFWALRDVSFDVQPGEVVGIIGRNGAGKSTLLKILSRITEPTSGSARLRGRVASLLEVGTGFHPELTGRENIFLNGAILGMSRAEVRQKFDEIVAFAEVEQFIDTPVKRYSSGMYVRLAFAVAAHLEPEILIVDEVLAVGDAEFQQKCMGKMSDVAKGGRTILFVSHNLDAVQRLTSRAFWLQQGQLKAQGPTAGVIRQYHSDSATFGDKMEHTFRSVGAPERVTIRKAYFSDAQGVQRRSFLPCEDIYLNIVMDGGESLPCELAFAIETDSRVPIFASHFSDLQDHAVIAGAVHARVALAPNLLRHGAYHVSLGVYAPEFKRTFDELLHMPAFSIEGFHPEMPADGRWGLVYLPLKWSLAPADGS